MYQVQYGRTSTPTQISAYPTGEAAIKAAKRHIQGIVDLLATKVGWTGSDATAASELENSIGQTVISDDGTPTVIDANIDGVPIYLEFRRV